MLWSWAYILYVGKEHLTDCNDRTSIFYRHWREPNGQIKRQASELRTSNIAPLLVKIEQTIAWTTGKCRVISTIMYPLPLNMCCASRKSWCIIDPPLVCSPQSTSLLHVPKKPHDKSITQHLDITVGCTRRWGENTTKTRSLQQNTLTHASACIQMHNQTQCQANKLLYICTVYQLCIV